MLEVLTTILAVLIASYLLGELCRLIKLPRVIGQIGAGLLLGIPPLREILFANGQLEVISFLANLGIILLFYYVGLELNLKVLRKYAKPSIAISISKTIVPLAIGYIVMHYAFGMDKVASIIIGLILSTSAQSVSLSLLEEKKMLKTKLGSMLLSIGVVTDVLELIIVSIVLAAFQLGNESISFVCSKYYYSSSRSS